MAKPTNELTPMQRQYQQIKEQNSDCILFFRLGDFYEMFNEDAKVAARELDLTLTSRDRSKPKEEQTPMCGVPYHSVDSYIARLVQKGYKVAICEQMTDPALSKGLVEREITRIVTPGTVTESCMLDENKNNYMGCRHRKLHAGRKQEQLHGLCLWRGRPVRPGLLRCVHRRFFRHGVRRPPERGLGAGALLPQRGAALRPAGGLRNH